MTQAQNYCNQNAIIAEICNDLNMLYDICYAEFVYLANSDKIHGISANIQSRHNIHTVTHPF